MRIDEPAAERPLSAEVSLLAEYEGWRARDPNGSGLAWYLAAELVQRFHASHGLVAEVILREGLGFYGIRLSTRPCKVAEKGENLGRLTIRGNVENWRLGQPGDHGLNLIERAEKGESPANLLPLAIDHLRLPAYPPTSHGRCDHLRRGASYVLVYQLAARLFLRGGDSGLRIAHGYNWLDAYDRPIESPHPPGWTRFRFRDREVTLTDGGVVAAPDSRGSVWERYMRGESIGGLVVWLEEELGFQAR